MSWMAVIGLWINPQSRLGHNGVLARNCPRTQLRLPYSHMYVLRQLSKSMVRRSDEFSMPFTECGSPPAR